jgi:hypothetical protein
MREPGWSIQGGWPVTFGNPEVSWLAIMSTGDRRGWIGKVQCHSQHSSPVLMLWLKSRMMTIFEQENACAADLGYSGMNVRRRHAVHLVLFLVLLLFSSQRSFDLQWRERADPSIACNGSLHGLRNVAASDVWNVDARDKQTGGWALVPCKERDD